MRRFTTTLIFVLFVCFVSACQSEEGPENSNSVQETAPPVVPTSTVEETGPTPLEETAPTPLEESAPTPLEESETAPVEETDTTSEKTDAYPAPYPAPTLDPYPGSETNEGASSDADETLPEVSNEPFEVPLPTDSTKGNIGGRLLRETPQGEEPFSNAILYLGHLVLDANGEESAAGFFEKSSPRTITNGAGHFLFENIEPKEYVLFYWTPQGSLMLLEPGTTNDMIFDLKAGEAIDTGSLAYDIPSY